jgi:tartrate-resistant acid phosphatase type 5
MIRKFFPTAVLLVLAACKSAAPPDAPHAGSDAHRTDTAPAATPAAPPDADSRGVSTAAAQPTASDAIQFAIIGDFGQDGPNEAAVAKLVHGWQPEFIVTLGDNNYPNGSGDTIDDNIAKYYGDYIAFNPNYQGRYRAHGAKENRFFPTLGNHDWRTPSLAPHYNMFSLPGNGRYYTVSRGPVDFFVVDSDPHEPDGTQPDSIQGRWLQKALAASQAPFKVVVMHHPPYSSGHHGSSTWMHWPYKAWGASVVLSGHDHCYERVEMDGFTYLVNGLGGANKHDFIRPPALPHATIDVGFSRAHGALHVHADKHRLTFDFFTVDNERVDTLTLTHDDV